jgi:hypothetical protein
MPQPATVNLYYPKISGVSLSLVAPRSRNEARIFIPGQVAGICPVALEVVKVGTAASRSAHQMLNILPSCSHHLVTTLVERSYAAHQGECRTNARRRDPKTLSIAQHKHYGVSVALPKMLNSAETSWRAHHSLQPVRR